MQPTPFQSTNRKAGFTMTLLRSLQFGLIIAIVPVLCFGQPKVESQKVDPLVSHIDITVKPGDDFFLYANGKWFKENPIPASEQSNGMWQVIQDTINAQV